MYKVTDFIKWALTHIKGIPEGAKLPLPHSECATEPWHYLFGSVRVQTTPNAIARYRDKYIAKGWKPETYDYYTKDWKSTDYATDCQGLLDAYLTYECDAKTDINANMNYTNWCTDKGKMADITRDYVIGEAVFVKKSNANTMNHIGWVCGFDADGEPLVVEARGLAHGVVVTKLSERPWTHRGLMKKIFDYEESEETQMVKFEVTSPLQSGEAFKAMQIALNKAGYADTDGNTLEEDGRWGKKSQAAFDCMISDYTPAEPEPAEPDDVPVVCGDAATLLIHGVRITISKADAD